MKRNQRVVSILFAFLLIISSILSPISAYAENTQEKESENVTSDEELEDKKEKEAIQEKSTNDSEVEKENDDKQAEKEKATDQDHTLSVETEDEEQSDPDEATEEEEKIQTKERAPPVTVNIRVETHEKTLVPSTEVTVDNFDLSEYGGPASTDSPRAIHAIIRALEKVEHLDLTNYDDFALEFDGNYIAGIDGLFEFDKGGNSGWMYFIDNRYVERGVLERKINDGESIVLFYTSNYMDNTFSWFDRESYSTQVGEALEIELTGVNFDVVNPVEGASILIDEKEYMVDGEKVLTDENGKITVQFDEPGTYHLSAQRKNDNDEHNIVRPYAIVEVTENDTDEKNKGNEEIDTEPPVITVEGLKDKETVTEEDITFTVDASDDVDGQIEPVVTVNGHNIQPKESNTYTTTLDEGTNTIVIEAIDSSDNYATKQYKLFYEPIEQDVGYDIENRIDKAADYILSKGIVSEWEAIGLARAGKEVPEDYRETLKNNIHSQITTRLPGRVKITDIERLAIAAVAIGEDPRDIEKLDLIDLIYNSPLRGSFDTMTFQGNNGPIFALIALDTLNFEEPFDAKWTRQKLIEELLNNQNPDGSWALNSTFPTPSVDVSAMAIIALAPYKEQPEVKRAIEGVLDYLSSVQNDEGGFTESFVGGTSSEATSQAIIGLTAYGLAPTDERFTKNGNNLIDHLLTYQNEDGGFGHLPGDRTNSMATEQALQALVAYDLYLKDQGRLYEFGGSKDNPDKDAAQEVVNKINELPSPQKITLNDQEKVEKVRKDYDALTDAQKQFVSNLSKLEALETKLEELEKQVAEDIAIAKALDEKINALPSVDKLTLEDKDSVEKVRQSFDKLTDEQKLIVSNLAKLESLEAKIEKLEKQLAEDKAAAKELDKKITALPNVQELSLADKKIVSEVRQAYEELTETQKSFVENISHLEALETKIKELEKQLAEDKAAAKELDKKITALPTVQELSLADKKIVGEVRQAYEELTETQKSFVENISHLEALETKIKELEQLEKDKAAAKTVDDVINSLPDVKDLTLDDKEAVSKARQAYEGLTSTQKEFVTSLDKLEKLENKMNKLMFTIDETDEGIVIKEYKGKDKNVIIPDKIDNKEVKEIAAGAFANKGIESVKLPNTLEVIGTNAFSDNEIREIILPASLKEIADNAFSNNKINEIVIPRNVTSIGKSAFKGNGITTVTFTTPVQVGDLSVTEVSSTAIGEEAFANNELTEIFIPEHIAVIGDRAFNNNVIQKVTIDNYEDRITIGKEAFANNGPDSDTEITPIFLKIYIDKTELEKLLTEAKNKEKDKYTKESFKKLQNAISLAEKIQTKENATEEEVDEAINVLAEAIEGLVILEKTKDPNPEKPTNPNPEELPKSSINGGEDNGENDSNGTNDDSTNENNGKPNSDLTANDDSVKKLPSTATQIYNLLLTGFVLIVFASILLYFNKRREVK